ncbi:MAG: PEGA domain-containing protein [Verrucomicrobia bacterium]|nr:PEGA domain-containing protein [Verrucomicrobiota bacterium]
MSDAGKQREKNGDACLLLPDKGVFCVADGKGGVVGHGFSSEAVTSNLQEVFAKAAPEATNGLSAGIAQVRKAASQASKALRNFADEKGTGQVISTFAGIVFSPRNPTRAAVLHAGDSRVYRLRANRLEPLTVDHTTAALLARDTGQDPADLPPEFQEELVQAVGAKAEVELEKTVVDVAGRDVFLICSDGLTKMMSDESIGRLLIKCGSLSLKDAAKKLVEAANRAGGNDNVTVVLVKVGDISKVSYEKGADDDEPLTAIKASPAKTPAPAPDRGERPKAAPAFDESPDADRAETPASRPAQTPEPAGAPRSGGMPVKAIVIAVVALVAVVGGIFMFKGRGSKTSAPTSAPTVESTPETNSTPTPAPSVAAKPPPEPPPPVAPPPVAPPAAVPAASATGHLRLQSEPAGVAVFRLGERVGETPYEAQQVAPGKLAFTLGSLTHTGAVEFTLAAGATYTTNVPLIPRLGSISLSSDPAGATVWNGGKALGKTPVDLKLPAGPQEFTLKFPGLPDASLKAKIEPDLIVKASVPFAYGGVVITSEPAGAAVKWNDKVVGKTPYTNSPLPVGRATWRLEAEHFEPTNVVTQILDHQTARLRVVLPRAHGTLDLQGNRAGIQARVDDGPPVAVPAKVSVTAGLSHTVVAEYKGQRRTNGPVQVDRSERQTLSFNFEEPKTTPPPAPSPAPPPPPANPAAKNELKKWISPLGIEFIRPAGQDFWITTARITPKQYEQITGSTLEDDEKGEDNGQPCVINTSYGDARAFAEKMSGLGARSGRPAGYETAHYALPTPEQWKILLDASDALGLPVKAQTKFSEWCLVITSRGAVAHQAGSNRGKMEVYERLPAPAASERDPYLTFRLVIVKSK